MRADDPGPAANEKPGRRGCESRGAGNGHAVCSRSRDGVYLYDPGRSTGSSSSGSSGRPGSTAEFRNWQRSTTSKSPGSARSPVTGPVTRELWLYSKKCAWRYFRVTDTGIEETGRPGNRSSRRENHSAGTGVVTAP